MTEINIRELSVGDWVKASGVAKRVHSIEYQNGTYFVNFSDPDANSEDYLHAPLVKPIPLTPEILEKNGFDAPKAKVWNDSWYWSNRKDVALELRESFGLWYMEIVTKEQRSGLQSNRKLGIGFKYVHELQHALRLAGVEKEIEL